MQSKTISKMNRPAKIKTSEESYETQRDGSLPSRKTRKSTYQAKLETLRRKSIRNLKQGKI